MLTQIKYNQVKGAPVNVMDYGATGDGTTDDAPFFSAALQSGAKHIIAPVPSVRYRFATPINMTTAAAAYTCHGTTLEFLGSMDVNATPNGSQPCIAAHTGVVLDMTGSRDCTIIGMNVLGDSSTTPQAMIFASRISAGQGCGRHRFYNIRSDGYYSAAVVYLYGSEENDFFAPFLMNKANGKAVVTITGFNIQTVTSSFQTTMSGAASTSVNNFYGGSFQQEGNSGVPNESVFYLDGCSDVNINNPFFYCPHGLAYVHISGANATCDFVRIHGVRGETGTGGVSIPQHGIYFATAATPRTHSSWVVRDSRLSCGVGAANGFMVYADNNMTLSNCQFSLLFNSIGNFISFYLLTQCVIDHSTNLVEGRSGGTSDKSVFIGSEGARTLLGTNTLNAYINTDTGTVKGSQLGVVGGTYGGAYKRKSSEAIVNISAAASVVTGNFFGAGIRILAAQFRVITALAVGDTWDAAFSGGATTSLVTAGAVTAATQATKQFVDQISSSNVAVTFTKNGGGSFTAQGSILVDVYYEDFDAMS